MDITETTAPKSDQQNYDDYANTSRVVTVTEVKRGSAEQPVEIHLAEFPGRPYKPSKSMRRVLAQAWGGDTSVYAGRKMRLYGDPEVKFGGSTVGGIKISELSHIEKRLSIHLTVTRGKRAPHKVEPLVEPAAPSEPSEADVAASTDADELRAWWKQSSPSRRTQIEARVKELSQLPQSSADVDPNAGLFDGDNA